MDQMLYETFKQFVTEREAIREARECGLPKPWTSDPVLQAYRFCNVDREDDTVTRWINKHIRVAFNGHTAQWFNLVIARFINYPETLQHLGFITEFNAKEFVAKMDDLQRQGKKLFGNAYMIRAGTGEDAGKPKHHYLADRVFGPLWAARSSQPAFFGGTCAAWDVWYRQTFGMGDFMRNQIITDMKYTIALRNATDWRTFCLAGPGTTRGLNRLMGRPLTAHAPAEVLNAELIAVRDSLLDEGFPLIQKFEDLNNLSNCFCEFDKYMRARNGEGRPKQNYPGV
jgi:hypothetical protein